MIAFFVGVVAGWLLRSFVHLLWPSGPRVTDRLSDEWLDHQAGK